MDVRRSALALALLALGPALRTEDCNRNGSEDAADIAEGRSADCNLNGVPDECDSLPAALELAPTVALDGPPTALAAADLDGDGDLDAAAAVARGVVILEGDGRGGLRAARTEPLDDDPLAVLAADMDGDGDTDLVLADALQDVRGRGALSVLENEGTGRFRPAAAITTPPGPAALAAADLDEDGDLDLALACRDAGGVAVLRGDGRGSYAEEPLLPAEGSPSVIAAVDLDGDRRIDIAAGDRASGVLFLLLRRAGGEMERSEVRLDAAFDAFAVGDLDGDGDADIAVGRPAIDGSGRLVVLENDGAGAFTAGAPRSVPENPRALAAADIDGDGRADVVTVEEAASSITIRPGRDAAPGSPGRGHVTGPGPLLAGAADLDGDGDLDLLVAEAGGLSVLLNAGSGRLAAPRSIHVGRGAGRMISVETLHDGRTVPLDLDGDGRLDLAVAHYRNDGRCTVLFGGDGGFPEEATSFAAGSGSRDVAAADVDGDGLPDLVVANVEGVGGSEQGLSLHLNSGHRSFLRAGVLAAGASMSSVAAGDFDQDGDMDLASLGDYLSLWENRGDGTFPRRTQLEVGGGAFELIAADLDGDLDLDLAAPAARDSRISIFENLGGGTYAVTRALEADGSRLVAADIDGDGGTDLAAGGREGLLLFWNRGDAAFERAVHPVAGYEIQSIAPADIDGDGDLDLAVAGFENKPLELVSNRGRRRLESLPPIPMAGTTWALGAADLDGDGRAEVLASRSVAGTILALRTIDPASSRDRNGNRVPDECEATLFVRGDADADGRIGIPDAILVLLHLFRGGPAPGCEASADTDGDGRVLLGDPVRLLGYLFRRSPEPAAPFPACDAPAPDEALDCMEYPPCAG